MQLSEKGSPEPKSGKSVDVFEVVAQALVDECGIPRESITLDSHVVDDLGVDSVAFLDLCYALDVKLNIKIPFEKWVNDINSGKVDAKEAFVLKAIVHEIELLVSEST
jgi:acyl carrier protein